MLKFPELGFTCKKVVRIFKIRFTLDGEMVSRDLPVDRTTNNRHEERTREEGLYLNFLLLSLSTCLGDPLQRPRL